MGTAIKNMKPTVLPKCKGGKVPPVYIVQRPDFSQDSSLSDRIEELGGFSRRLKTDNARPLLSARDNYCTFQFLIII